jgi:hypothetical protein
MSNVETTGLHTIMGNGVTQFLGNTLAKYLTKTVASYKPFSVHHHSTLASVMQPGDVLLVEGDHRISTAIKYLTQSTWSHAAFYLGTQSHSLDISRPVRTGDTEEVLIEADLENGVITVPLSKYTRYNIRICRPYQLTDSDRAKLCDYMIDSLGMKYDLKNITDLARYLLPQPPVPARFRRRMLSLGSGDPTRAVCSSLIAQAFQSVRYPILPSKVCCDPNGNLRNELMHIRHHSLFTPRDFDVSPYFEIVKPELTDNFDYKALNWHNHSNVFIETGEIAGDISCDLLTNDSTDHSDTQTKGNS